MENETYLTRNCACNDKIKYFIGTTSRRVISFILIICSYSAFVQQNLYFIFTNSFCCLWWLLPFYMHMLLDSNAYDLKNTIILGQVVETKLYSSTQSRPKFLWNYIYAFCLNIELNYFTLRMETICPIV
jgi:hypothetical protein